MLAYLSMMAPRLIELRRVLKPTGSIYLHCGPTASHYLKMLMDAIFTPLGFLSEITWKRIHSHGNVGRNFGSICDVLLVYTKEREYTWNQQYTAFTPEYIEATFKCGVGDAADRRHDFGGGLAPTAERAREGRHPARPTPTATLPVRRRRGAASPRRAIRRSRRVHQ